MADSSGNACVYIGEISYKEAYRSGRITGHKSFDRKDDPKEGKQDGFYQAVRFLCQNFF